MADEIDIGGVIKPSANNAEQPINAAIKGHFAGCFFTNAYKEKIPPSPLLSAFKARMIYLKEVMIINVQKIQESAPKMSSLLIGSLPTIALITYKGEVPISPKIIPRVISKPLALSFLLFVSCFSKKLD